MELTNTYGSFVCTFVPALLNGTVSYLIDVGVGVGSGMIGFVP